LEPRMARGVVGVRLLAGLAAAAVLGSLLDGGYVLYVNRLVVGFMSEPLLVSLLRLAAGLVALWVGLRLLGLYLEPVGGLFAFSAVLWGLLSLLAASQWAALAAVVVLAVPAAGVLAGRGVLRGVAAAAVFTVLLLGPALAGLLHFVGLAEASKAVRVVELDNHIDVSGLQRLIPLMTAYVYASDRIQSPLHRVYPEDSYIYYNGSRSVYNWIVEPEGFWNQLTRRPLGVVFVYGDEYPPRVRLVEAPLVWGLHVRRLRLLPPMFDTLERRIVSAAGVGLEPVMEDNVEVLHGGHVYILVPLVEWRQSLLASIPVPAGYAVVNEDGSVRVMSIGEARGSPLLRGVPLLPEAVARYWVEALRYRHGLVAYLFYHETFRVPDVGANPQPYLLLGPGSRLYWVTVAEPAGETYSARYIFYTPTDATEPVVLAYTLPRPVIGVSKAASYVKQAHPNYDWGQLTLEEPMPSIINGTLYWKVTITTKDHRGLVSVDLLNAETGEVVSLRPQPRITSLDALNAILGHSTAKEPKGPVEKLREIRERLAQIQRQLGELQRELEQLEKQLEANATETGGR